MALTDAPRAEPGEREIVSTRVFPAPRERVYRAFSDPDLLARWWGPEGFTNTFHEFDPRPGGAWTFTMRGPDGAEYRMEKRFVEVVPSERVVLDHPQPGHSFRMTMAYADEAGGARLTWSTVFESAEEAGRVRDLFARANEQNFDRLAALLSIPAAPGAPA